MFPIVDNPTKTCTHMANIQVMFRYHIQAVHRKPTVLPRLEVHAVVKWGLADMPLYPEYSGMPLYEAEKVIVDIWQIVVLLLSYHTNTPTKVVYLVQIGVLPHKYHH